MTEFQVSHTVTWAVVGTIDSVPSVMSWTSEDPLAVEVSFGQGDGDHVEWKFARDLLADVVSGKLPRAGEGDVCVRRQKDNASQDQLILSLTVGFTRELRTDLEEIRIFLQNTYMYAPQGEELIDMDATIDKILGGGQASGV